MRNGLSKLERNWLKEMSKQETKQEDLQTSSQTNLAKQGVIGRKTGIAAQREAARQALENQGPKDLTSFPNKIGMVFDNSGSMAGKSIDDAKIGCEEFFKVCNPLDTAIALYDMGNSRGQLETDLIKLIQISRKYTADYGTPLYGTLQALIDNVPLNRAIVFSDGEPTDEVLAPVVEDFIKREIPIDCVFIGQLGSRGEPILRDIATRTGGIFLHFVKGSTTMRQAFKYLAPRFRAMLTDGNFKSKLERGEV